MASTSSWRRLTAATRTDHHGSCAGSAGWSSDVGTRRASSHARSSCSDGQILRIVCARAAEPGSSASARGWCSSSSAGAAQGRVRAGGRRPESRPGVRSGSCCDAAQTPTSRGRRPLRCQETSGQAGTPASCVGPNLMKACCCNPNPSGNAGTAVWPVRRAHRNWVTEPWNSNQSSVL
jgi:hypothetical protein